MSRRTNVRVLMVGFAIAAIASLSPAAAEVQGPSSVYSPGIQRPAPTGEVGAQQACIGGEKVLLIQDVVPWFASTNPLGADAEELAAQGLPWCMINSGQLSATDLSKYALVIIPSDQTAGYYSRLFPGGVIHPKLDAWTTNGGILSASLADCGWNYGMWAYTSYGNYCDWPYANVNTSFRFVGGLLHQTSFDSHDLAISDASHPIVADALLCPGGNCGPLADRGYRDHIDGWNTGAHGFFLDLPEGTTTILTQPDVTGDGAREPVLVEYPYGSGRVIASMTTTEWWYIASPSVKRLLANDIAYQMSLLDRTPPIVVGRLTPEPNDAGWNNSDVMVTWAASDPESGIRSELGCDPLTFADETAGTTFTCTAVNHAGLSATGEVRLMLDKTPPSISGRASPEPNDAGWNNADVTVVYTCDDALSGVLGCQDPVTVSQDGAGQFATGTAEDVAGNKTSVTVGPINIDKTPSDTVMTTSSGAPIVRAFGFTVDGLAFDSGSGVASTSVVFEDVLGVVTAVQATCTANCGGAVSAWSTAVPQELAPGVYRVSASSRDAADNQGPSSGTKTIVVV